MIRGLQGFFRLPTPYDPLAPLERCVRRTGSESPCIHALVLHLFVWLLGATHVAGTAAGSLSHA